MDTKQIKIPPHNLEAEQAIIASMMINPSIIPGVEDLLSPDDFYRESHSIIVKSFFDLNGKAELITVVQDLTERGQLEKVGGVEYLSNLSDSISTSAGYRHYCEILSKLSRRRKLMDLCHIVLENASDQTVDLDNVFTDLKTGAGAIITDRERGYRPNADLIKEVFKDIETRTENGNRFVGVKTGLDNIDYNQFGLEPKTSTYLIARPSMGKTALALNIADHIALNYSGKVLFFSLESGDKALTRRRLSIHSGIHLSKIRTGNIADSQWPSFIKASDTLSENNLIIFDRPIYKTIESLTTMVEAMATEQPISLVVIDHIQRMRTRKKVQNRHLELSHISEEISSLSNTLNIPILALCQLSRKVEDRPKNKQEPRLYDMKESGDLEQNADTVWGLYRKTNDAEVARLECLKGRDTGTWSTWLRFDRYTQKFTDCKDPEEQPEDDSRGYNG